jgi:hypothetical protein
MPELLRPATTALSLGSFTRPPLLFSAVQAVYTAGIIANLS